VRGALDCGERLTDHSVTSLSEACRDAGLFDPRAKSGLNDKLLEHAVNQAGLLTNHPDKALTALRGG
jgi:hypothetical protein